MKIICLVKFVPDVDNFAYDYEKNILVRENVKLILNPEDACALALALKIKESNADTFIELVSMAPKGILPLLEDLLRRNVDKATLISDSLYVGSDTYVTSKILAKYLESQEFNCLLTGTHSLDGDTSHIPSQIGELLQIGQLSNVVKVYGDEFNKDCVEVLVDCDKAYLKYELALPCILSIGKESQLKLPFVKYKDLELDVSDRISVITNEDLGFIKEDVGLKGSLTKVNRTYTKKLEHKAKLMVQNDQEGIDTVYQFLKLKGYIK